MRTRRQKLEQPFHQLHHAHDPDDYPAVEYLDISPIEPNPDVPTHSEVQETLTAERANDCPAPTAYGPEGPVRLTEG